MLNEHVSKKTFGTRETCFFSPCVAPDLVGITSNSGSAAGGDDHDDHDCRETAEADYLTNSALHDFTSTNKSPLGVGGSGVFLLGLVRVFVHHCF